MRTFIRNLFNRCEFSINKKPNEAGFTLVELLVVITLISLSASIAFIAYQGISGKFMLQQTSKKIIVLLRKARIKAVTDQLDQLVFLDLSSREISSTNNRQVITIPKTLQIYLKAAGGQIAGRSISDNQSNPNAQAGIRFFATGGSTGATIKIGTTSQWQEISIDWLTGTVNLVEIDE